MRILKGHSLGRMGIALYINYPGLFLLERRFCERVMDYGYYALFQQEAETGFGATHRVLAAFIVPAALFLLAGSQGRRIPIAVSGTVLLSYSSTLFLLGSRAWAVMPLIGFHLALASMYSPLLRGRRYLLWVVSCFL